MELAGGVAGDAGVRREGFGDDGASADSGVGTDVDGADEDGGSADIDVVFEDRAAVVGCAAIAEGGAVAEDAVGADDGAVVDDEPLAVVEGEPGTDFG